MDTGSAVTAPTRSAGTPVRSDLAQVHTDGRPSLTITAEAVLGPVGYAPASASCACGVCGASPEPRRLFGIGAHGRTVAELAEVVTWMCATCFVAGAAIRGGTVATRRHRGEVACG